MSKRYVVRSRSSERHEVIDMLSGMVVRTLATRELAQWHADKLNAKGGGK